MQWLPDNIADAALTMAKTGLLARKK